MAGPSEPTVDPEYELVPVGATVEVAPTTLAPSSRGPPRPPRPAVCTFGCAPRFGSKPKNLTSAPDGNAFYGRNELYGSMSCLESRKPFGKFQKSVRKTGQAEPRGTDEWTGPGSHKVDGAAQSMKGGMKSSPIDGKEFCHFTMKRGPFSTQDIKHWNPDLMYVLPSTKSTLGGANSKSIRKSPFEGAKVLDKFYDQPWHQTEVNWGGTDEFKKSSFGGAPRSKPVEDNFNPIFYGNIVLSKDQRMRENRSAAVRGKQKTPYYQSVLKRNAPSCGPGTFEISRDLTKKSYNQHFIKSKEWQDTINEPKLTFGPSAMSRSVPTLKSTL